MRFFYRYLFNVFTKKKVPDYSNRLRVARMFNRIKNTPLSQIRIIVWVAFSHWLNNVGLGCVYTRTLRPKSASRRINPFDEPSTATGGRGGLMKSCFRTRDERSDRGRCYGFRGLGRFPSDDVFGIRPIRSLVDNTAKTENVDTVRDSASSRIPVNPRLRPNASSIYITTIFL